MSSNNQIWQLFVAFMIAGASIGFAILCSSCKTCVPVVEIRDSVRVEYKHDSIYEYKHDSIFRDRWRSGDTVYVNVERWAIRYKDKIVEVHDTVATNTEIVQERKVVPPYYKGCSIALWIIVACAVVGIIIRILIKVYLKR